MRDTNVGMLPVHNRRGQTVGVVTDRDLAMRVCAEARSPTDTQVGEVASRILIACHESDTLHRVEQLMSENHKSRVLVFGGHGKLSGVISLADIAVHDQPRAGETLRHVAEREVLAQHGGVR
jgi:CBS domain-containing protein